MAISDIKGEAVFDLIADIIDPVANIVSDAQVAELFASGGINADTAKEYAPELIKRHKEDVIAIMAAIRGVTPEEYAATLNVMTLFRDVMEIITDKELLGFLTSLGASEESAQPSTSTTFAAGA